MSAQVEDALAKIAERFEGLDWTLHDVPGTAGAEQGWQWLGGSGEDVMVCVFRGTRIHEEFHRQDFFFFNYAYEGDFQAVSQRRGNRVDVAQDELVAGQPFTGYALDSDSEHRITIVGVLIKKELFFEGFLPFIQHSRRLLHFFIDPEGDAFSNDFLHVRAKAGLPYRKLLELMAVEYANGQDGSQDVLRRLAETLAIWVARQFEEENPHAEEWTRLKEIVDFIRSHPESATLARVSKQFGYHPNYLSSLVHKETGTTFSRFRQDARMDRARLLLEKTTLSVAQVAQMVGYASTSNFHAAFRKRFGSSPRAVGEAGGQDVKASA